MQADAAIVLHLNFEIVIAKIQDGRANELTVQQKRAVEFLKQNAAAENSEDDYSQLSLADRALKTPPTWSARICYLYGHHISATYI